MVLFHCCLSEPRQMSHRELSTERVASISCHFSWCVSNLPSLKPSLTGALLSFPVLFQQQYVILLVLCSLSPTTFP